MIKKIIISTIIILVCGWVLPGVIIPDLFIALGIAIGLSLINHFLKPTLEFFNMPITLLAFGSFMFVLNVASVQVLTMIFPTFIIDSFMNIILFSGLYSFLHSMYFEEYLED